MNFLKINIWSDLFALTTFYCCTNQCITTCAHTLVFNGFKLRNDVLEHEPYIRDLLVWHNNYPKVKRSLCYWMFWGRKVQYHLFLFKCVWEAHLNAIFFNENLSDRFSITFVNVLHASYSPIMLCWLQLGKMSFQTLSRYFFIYWRKLVSEDHAVPNHILKKKPHTD